ncbi:MAG: hypothetical protein K5675_01635 [Lachnospiraceae bacterium]|nr:hypothetical protein [Lachnospiraceae bacterium]
MIKFTSVKNEGFEGILFSADDTKEKVMIVMSGSNGGMTLTKKTAEFYEKNQIAALALGLFRTKETPKELSRIPIEYVERAICWLKKMGYQNIGIDGTSKGSELALLAASMFPEISCVVARVPSYFISEGLAGSGKNKHPSGTSCWSYNGREIPFAPYKSREFHIGKMLLKEKELHIITFNKEKDITPETIIPIEKITAPILFLSSKHDEIWPSYESSCLMEERLKAAGFSYSFRHVSFEHVSHMMATEIPWFYKLAFKTERQRPKECLSDRKALKRELLDWVENVWETSKE